MPFEYACFISYARGKQKLMNRLTEKIIESLEDFLDFYFDKEVYIDREQLKPGCYFDEELGEAICKSICMIVIYSPKYASHEYCLREYTAMEKVQAQRIKLLDGKKRKKKGMIIPVIISGKIEELPEKIKDNVHICDLRGYTINSDREIKFDEECMNRIKSVAEVINDVNKSFKGIDPLCLKCASFKVPSVEEIKPWIDDSEKSEMEKRRLSFFGPEV